MQIIIKRKDETNLSLQETKERNRRVEEMKRQGYDRRRITEEMEAERRAKDDGVKL